MLNRATPPPMLAFTLDERDDDALAGAVSAACEQLDEVTENIKRVCDADEQRERRR